MRAACDALNGRRHYILHFPATSFSGKRHRPGKEQNWLPTPSARFKLMLRAYLPGAAILDGTYRPPQVVKA